MSDTEKKEKELTVKEAAALLGCIPATINNNIKSGKIPNARKEFLPSGQFMWMIPASSLEGLEIKMGRPKKQK